MKTNFYVIFCRKVNTFCFCCLVASYTVCLLINKYIFTGEYGLSFVPFSFRKVYVFFENLFHGVAVYSGVALIGRLEGNVIFIGRHKGRLPELSASIGLLIISRCYFVKFALS